VSPSPSDANQSSVGPLRVSVVLVAFNRAPFLGATIESILGQSFADFELIVCDDASTDDTPAIVQKYAATDRRVRLVRGEHNIGMPANLNRGIRLARGEYVANLHDGDIYRNDLLEKWSAVLDRYPTAGFVFNQYETVGRLDSEPLRELTPGHILLEQFFFRRWRFSSPVWGTVMARRRIYEEYGYFDARFGFLADVAMWMRIAESWDVGYVAEPLIFIPPRERVPRLFDLKFRTSQRILEAMHREAVDRHWAGNRTMWWLGRSRLLVYGVLCRLEYIALAARRFVLTLIGKRPRQPAPSHA
jgi:glycosyltransferase involved in cell wall biosynthesis